MQKMILDLFGHMEWADARVWDAALKTPEARSDDTLKWLMLHLHGVQKAFLDAWTSQPFSFRSDYSGTSLEQEIASVRAYYPHGRGYLESLTEAEMAAQLVLPWTKFAAKTIGRPAASTTLGETILQSLMHSTHHR